MVDAAFPISRASAAAGRSTRRPIVALFLLGVMSLLLIGSAGILTDPDTYWHVAVGEFIWTTGAFPRVEEFSHTFAGAPWIAKEWLSQLILFGVHAAAGWWGVAVFTAVVASASFAGLFAWLLRRVQPTAAFAIVGVALVLTAAHILARPHVFFFPLLMIWIGSLVEAVERDAPPPWLLVPMMALWANLHASFTIAFVIAAILAADAVAKAPAAARRTAALQWAAFGLAALLASGATPYGFEPLLVTFKIFEANEAILYIKEWQPLGLDPGGVLAVAALLAAAALLLAAPRQNVFRLLLVLLCGYLMIRHARFINLFAIVTAFLVARPLAERFPQLGPDARPMAARSLAVTRMGVLALAVATSALAATARPEPDAEITPVAALAAARASGVSGRVYNDYDFGGYLISQGVKTFIDGRSDQIFVGGFMNGLYSAVESGDPAPFLALLEKHGVNWAIIRPDSEEAQHLTGQRNWAKIYEDPIAAVYRRR